MHPKIAPSFLTADFGRLADEVRAVEEAGADYLHLDVMDGQFVPPISFGSIVVKAIRRLTSLPLDVHLMVERPERHVEAFAKAGGDILNVHAEACDETTRVIEQIKTLGCRAGICLSPPTAVSTIENILTDVDQVLVMGVNPGWGGQALIPETLPKIRQLRDLLDQRGLTTDIEIDGGVKVNNCGSCVQAGATVFVAGSVVFNNEAPVAENMLALRSALSDASR
jgi:ribulose-phosphate 3-epimerase